MKLAGVHVVVVGAPSRIGHAVALRILLAAALLLAACATTPRSSASATANALEGTWALVAADDILPDGTRVRAYGPSPRGLFIVDAEGRYSLQIFRSERPLFASGNKQQGTPDEYQAAVLGMSSHVGWCGVDADGRALIFRIEQASYPNWNGTEQQRQFTLQGDELSYRQSPRANGVVSLSVWRRVRPAPP